MRCFRLNNAFGHAGSFCVILCGLVSAAHFSSCRSQYRHLQPATGDVKCVKAFKPQFSNTLYSAIIDVTKHHFSGILYFKAMPDSSTRIVFTNEIGVKFFDFAFAKDGTFTKHYILPKMDKKVVIKALRNDLRLVMVDPDMHQAKLLKDSMYNYIAVPTEKGNDYYITTTDCTKLLRIEKASKRKSVVVAELMDYKNGVPDSIYLHHRNFKFNISLKREEK